MVVHGKVRWTSSRCMVAYGGHALMENKCGFEIEKGELDFKFKHQASWSQILNIGGRFEFKQ